jgi:hypothetical protein
MARCSKRVLHETAGTITYWATETVTTRGGRPFGFISLGVEAGAAGSRTSSVRSTFVIGRGHRNLLRVRGHDGVADAQPMAEVLHHTRVLVDETKAVAASGQEFGQGFKERAERVSSEPADVMRSSKEFLEHGCPPRDREESSRESIRIMRTCVCKKRPTEIAESTENED